MTKEEARIAHEAISFTLGELFFPDGISGEEDFLEYVYQRQLDIFVKYLRTRNCSD